MSLYVSAPSSPNHFSGPRDYYYHHASAPTSPTRAATAISWFDDMHVVDNDGGLVDFAFSFAGQPEEGAPSQALTPADELFEAGRIRPLNPIQLITPQIETRRGEDERGRERALSVSTPRSCTRATRSLSPIRGQGLVSPSPSAITASTTTSKDGGSKRWRLRDLLLFRSASEGRATERGSKDPLCKYTFLSPSTRRAMDAGKGARGAASATEIHYTENRAASEGMRKKTALPYHRVGIFGYLGFNPAITRSRGRSSSS